MYKIPKSVVLLLSGGVPQLHLYVTSVELDVGHRSLEHSWQVLLGELIATEDIQKTCLTTAAITHHDDVHSALHKPVTDDNNISPMTQERNYTL